MTASQKRRDRVVVLGGGGVAGIAWEIGVLAVFAEHGVDVAAQCDHVLGTSAGATVGAYIAAGRSLPALEAAQRTPIADTREFVPPLDLTLLAEIFQRVATPSDDPVDDRRAVGAMALAVPTVTEAERREVIAWRLGTDEWPARPLTVTAVEVDTGERVLFNRDSGVGLIDAVAASCAVPGVWPPVTIHGQRFIDGGVYSATNHDVITSTTMKVILRPGAPEPSLLTLPDQEAFVLFANEASLSAFGPNVLDPSVRAASLDAGRAQAEVVVDQLRTFWTSDR